MKRRDLFYSNEEPLEEKYELETLEEVFVDGKLKKVLVIKGRDMDENVPGSSMLEALTEICEEESVEVGTLTDVSIREYMGTSTERETEQKESCIKDLESALGVPMEEDVYSLLAEKIKAAVEEAEVVVYFSGCPCCVESSQKSREAFESTYKNLLETFGPEKVYLGATNGTIETHAGRSSLFPYGIWKAVPEHSEHFTEEDKAEIQKEIDETPEKIKFLVFEYKKLKGGK